eukprot:COSAG02_NODE_26349_length_635_cov_0.735075_1_plen_92_part_00
MYRVVSIIIKEGREGGRLFVAVGRFELFVGLKLVLCLLFASGYVTPQRHPPLRHSIQRVAILFSDITRPFEFLVISNSERLVWYVIDGVSE